MEALIHDLLELSRIEGIAVRTELVDPQRSTPATPGRAQAALGRVRRRSRASPTDPPMVSCERTRLYQLFANLINNALDHMGTVPAPKIQVTVSEDDAHTRLDVTDNGSGVDPKHHHSIFEIFESFGKDAAASGRTGMGLAIVKKIVEGRGGRVWIESALGEGASFHVELPRH